MTLPFHAPGLQTILKDAQISFFTKRFFPNPKWPDIQSAVKDDGKVLPYRWLGS